MTQKIVRRSVRKGDHGGAVKKLQRALGLKPDGAFGVRTKRRLKRWQRKHGLTPDGKAGKKTWHSLGFTLEVPNGRVMLARGVRPAGHDLMRRIRAVARETGVDILIKSGDRTQAECEHFWRVYQAGGALAARPWSCGGKCCSNHARGRAIDCGTLVGGKYNSIGYHARVMKSVHKHGLWLAVRYSNGRVREQWHLEVRR
jgi:hypothetical protein